MSITRSRFKLFLEYKLKFPLKRATIDDAVREYNNFQMPISLRIKLILSSEEEFKKFKLFYLNKLFEIASEGIL